MNISKNCKGCGNHFSFEMGDDRESESFSRLVQFCPACSELAEKRRAFEIEQANKETIEVRWKTICPPLFQETEVERLPIPSKYQECLKWNGERGLMLFGETRKGKSRCAWLLLRREFDRNRRITVMDSLSGFDYGSQFADSARAAEQWILKRCECDLLFMDDVFKVKLTDSFEAAIFAIVDYRLNHKRTILATCNDTGASLVARMSEDRGAAFVARLKESCETISF